jgi:hypothetical protein
VQGEAVSTNASGRVDWPSDHGSCIDSPSLVAFLPIDQDTKRTKVSSVLKPVVSHAGGSEVVKA